MGFPVLILDSGLQNLHTFIKNLFQGIEAPQTPLAGRLKYFLKNRKKLTSDSNILGITQRFQIPCKRKPFQKSKILREIDISKDQKILVNLEISDVLKKGAIRECQPHRNQFVSTLFLVGKKNGGNRPVINLKKLDKLIRYQHLKMKGLHYLRYMLQQGDYMCKLDMKNAYFSVPLRRNCRDKVRFQWSGTLYEFLCLCFGLGPAPRIFTKILKVPVSLIRRWNIVIAIYLDGILLLGRSIKEVLIATDTVIFLLIFLLICNQPQKVHSDCPTKNRAHRSFKFNSTSNVTCTTSVLVFTTNSGRIAQSRPFISTSSNLEFQCKTGTSFVGPKLKTVQWKLSCTTPNTNGDLNGCSQNR